MKLVIGLLGVTLVCTGSFGAADHIGPAIAEVGPRSTRPLVREHAPNNDRVLVVLFSGARSCEDDSESNFLDEKVRLLTAAAKKKNPNATIDVLRYCWEKDLHVREKPIGSNKISSAELTEREALARISALQGEYEDLVILSHSWGAWDAMRGVSGWPKPKLDINEMNPYPGLGEETFGGKVEPGSFAEGIHEGYKKGAQDALKGLPKKKVPPYDPNDEYASGYWTAYANWDGGYDQTRETMEIPDVPPLKPSVLITYDPISRTHCRRYDVIKKISSPGCREFPSDISQRAVRDGAGVWLNYYQDRPGQKVHSGYATAANNRKQWVREGGHSSMRHDNMLRPEVEEAILGALD